MADEKNQSETPERAPGEPQKAESEAARAAEPGASAADRPQTGTGPGAGTGSGAGAGPGAGPSAPTGSGAVRPAAGAGGGRGGGRGYGGGGGARGRFGGGGPRDGFGRPRDRGGRGPRDDDAESQLAERVVKINRCATVVKGGRRFSFSALVVVGDRAGTVGIGFGKANEVPPSVEKAVKDAKKNFVKVCLKGHTIPHQSWGRYRTSKVVLVPAVEGTGVIAGASVRAVVECAGVKNLLSKVYGSTNPLNVVKATLDALEQLRAAEEIARIRGVEVAQ